MTKRSPMSHYQANPHAKKSLGQHFLSDTFVVDQIIQAVARNQAETSRLIEIGPGKGVLSKELFSLGKPITLLEIDPRMVDVLKNEVIPFAEVSVQILQEDVLSPEWWSKEQQWADQFAPSSSIELIGNLPYYITSPILFGVMERRSAIERATFMIQKEVADRILAPSGSKTYGILSVQCQLMASVTHVLDVPPTAFDPPPNVESSVIQLTFDKPKQPFSDETLKKVVRTAFQQRRKKLSNALSGLLDVEQRQTITQDLGLSFDQRAEQWTPHDYARLSEWVELHT